MEVCNHDISIQDDLDCKLFSFEQETGDSQSISEEDDSELSTYASEEPPATQASQPHPLLRRQKTQQVNNVLN